MRERKNRSTPWQELARDPAVMADLIGQFEETHGFSFAQTPFKKLRGLIVTPEMLVQTEAPLGGFLNAIGILRHLVLGNVVIDPFNPNQLGPNSYDVLLGNRYFLAYEAFQSVDEMMAMTHQVVRGPPERYGVHQVHPFGNPQDPKNVERTWRGPLKAIPLEDLGCLLPLDRPLGDLENAEKYPFSTTQIIILYPGQMILCHTEEFIGGRRCIVPFMQARSTTGRSAITVCEDSGLGTIGFIGRWTMEVRNKSLKKPIF